MTPENSSACLDRKLAFFVLRLSLGINVLMHGATRIFGAGGEAFAAKTAILFTGTALPSGLAHAFLVVLPFAEFVLGILLVAGLFTRWALTLGGLSITALIFGTAMRSDWQTVGIQMIYSVTYYFLLSHRADDGFSLDALWARKRA